MHVFLYFASLISKRTMGMQLTETLNGILPIAATDDFHKDEHTNTIHLQNKTNAVGCYLSNEISIMQIAYNFTKTYSFL